MRGWISLTRSDALDALIRDHPSAFLLLTQIALRARYVEEPCPVTKIGFRQCLIGDWRNAGLSSEKQYRIAKKVLIDCNFGAFKGANKGTVATLLESSPYEISNTRLGEAEGQAKGERGATKKKVIREEQEIELPFPSDAFANAWQDWLQYRIEKKKPVTPISAKKTFAAFLEAGELASIESINTAIRNSWQGVFPKAVAQQPSPPPTNDLFRQISRQ